MASTLSSVIDARKQYFYVSLFCFSVLLTGTEDFALSLFLAPFIFGIWWFNLVCIWGFVVWLIGLSSSCCVMPWFFSLVVLGIFAKILVVERYWLVRRLIWEIGFGLWCVCFCEVWLRKLNNWFFHLLELPSEMGVDGYGSSFEHFFLL